MKKFVIFLILLLFSVSYTGKAGNYKLKFSISEKSTVSAGIYNERGALIKILLCGKKYKPGNYEITWDGKDEDGKEVSGHFKYKLLIVPYKGIKVEYVLGAGNAGKPPYRTMDGKGSWGGVWGDVVDIATDDTGIYLLWGQEEGEGSLVKVDFNGKVIWKQHQTPFWIGNNTALCVNKKYVFISIDAKKGKEKRQTLIWRVKKDNGEYALFPDIKYIYAGSPYSISRKILLWEDLVENGFKKPACFWETDTTSIAATDDKLYIPLKSQNKIEVYDTETGKKISEIKVEKPGGIDVDKKGNIFVISGKKVLMIDKSESLKTFIERNLDSPFGLCVSEKGFLYITDLGKSQQIKIFDRYGRLKKTIGKKGGRRWCGKFDRYNLLMPLNPAVDKKGNIYVGENAAPRRVVIFDKKGKFKDNWIGPEYYSGAVCVDPYQPKYIYATLGRRIYRFVVDYKNKNWDVDAVWQWKYGSHGSPTSKHSLTSVWMNPFVVEKDGKKFLFIGSGNISLFKIDNYNLIPSTCVCIGRFPSDVDKGWVKNGKLKNVVDLRKDGKVAIWRDINGDGLAEKEEVFIYDAPEGKFPGVYWTGSINNDLDISGLYLSDGRFWILPFENFDKKGNPVYSWDKAKIIGQPLGNLFYHSGFREFDDGYYITAQWGAKGEVKGIGWSSRVGENKVIKYDKEGNLIFKVGKKAKGFSKPGESYNLIRPTGKVGEFVFFADVNGQERVWTEDGLFVCNLLKDQYRGPLPDYDILWVEHFGSYVFKNREDGNIYMVAGSDAIHIWKINGFEKIKEIQGVIK